MELEQPQIKWNNLNFALIDYSPNRDGRTGTPHNNPLLAECRVTD